MLKATIYSDLIKEGTRMEFTDIEIIGIKPTEEDEEESELDATTLYCRTKCPIAS